MINNIKDFDKLTIQEQVDFINNELQKDKKISVTKLCKKYGFNKSTVIGRFLDSGYKYNIDTREYILATDMIQNDIKNKNIEQVAPKDNNIDEDIKELLKYKDDIIDMIKQYQNNSTTTNMIIDVGLVGGKTVNHNFKIYENVKKEIQELQSQYPHFRLTDLVSTALHEYYLKYSKK